jgi:hypothetical protein
MNLENIMLSEKKPSDKWTSIVWFHLYEVPKKGKFMETEVYSRLPEAGGSSNEEWLLIIPEFPSGMMEKT